MKGLTLLQPFASLIAVGAKRIETRSWSTSHRGLVAIHAATRFPPEAQGFAEEDVVQGPLVRAGVVPRDWAPWNHKGRSIADLLPQGAIVAVANLWDCRHIGERPERNWPPTDPNELAYGDYRDDRWMWFLNDVRRLAQPVPCRGFQRLWTVPADVEAKIRRQLPGNTQAGG